MIVEKKRKKYTQMPSYGPRERNWPTWWRSDLFLRGEEQLYLPGLIELQELGPNEVKATALGTSAYSVTLSRNDNGRLTGNCTCPAFRDFGPCKHIAGAGFTLIDHHARGKYYPCKDFEKKKNRLSLTGEQRSEKLKELKARTETDLKKKQKTELVEMLMKVFDKQTNPDPWKMFYGTRLDDLLYAPKSQERSSAGSHQSLTQKLESLEQERQNIARNIALKERKKEDVYDWIDSREAKQMFRRSCDRILEYKLTRNELDQEIEGLEKNLKRVDQKRLEVQLQLSGGGPTTNTSGSNASSSKRKWPAGGAMTPQGYRVKRRRRQ